MIWIVDFSCSWAIPRTFFELVGGCLVFTQVQMLCNSNIWEPHAPRSLFLSQRSTRSGFTFNMLA